jgi:putative transposase
MPRPPRLHVPGGCYHVILRGNHREDLFASPNDRAALNEIVIDVMQRFDSRLHAFCWMSNHLHALIQIGERPLGKLMQRIAMRYSRYRHSALQTTGHLFERRYKAWLVDVDNYFLTLLRYIHLNPVEAGMVREPADYPWSSHRAYLGVDTLSWLTTDFGLSLFAADLAQARLGYQQFIAQGMDEDIESAIHPDDPRVLGRDNFVNHIPFTPYKPRSPLSLQQLAEHVCTEHRISVDLLRSTSRARSLTPIRIVFAARAIEQRVGTLTDAADFLRRDPSTLVRLLARYSPVDR